MAKALALQDASGQPLAPFNFGEVARGQLSPQKPIRLVNTGDVPLSGVRAWIEQASEGDGALRVSLGGVAVTGTSAETATALPDLAVGAKLDGFAQFSGPSIPVDTGVLRVVSN